MNNNLRNLRARKTNLANGTMVTFKDAFLFRKQIPHR